MKRQWKRHRPLFSNTLPQDLKKPKIKWKIFPIFWLAVKRLAMVIGMFMLINIVLVAVLTSMISSETQPVPSIPSEAVLLLNLENGLTETPEFQGFSDPFASQPATVHELVEALDAAATDKRIQGLVARMDGGNYDLAHSFEIRQALKRFRKSGKFAYLYSTSLGEGGGGLGRYYLASAFEQIWMQPLGIVSIMGVSVEIPYARTLLDNLGVSPQFFQRKEYKSAMETITNTSMSAASREEYTTIVNDIRAQILHEIPADRKMTPAVFEGWLNKGLLTAKEAQKARVIDQAQYGDVLLENIAQKLYGERDASRLTMLDMNEYVVHTVRKKHESMSGFMGHKPRVALVYAIGAIVRSSIDGGEFGEDRIVAADELAPLLKEIARDKSIDAVVLRIDSPGGSPTASESILRAIEKIKESKKPVIVSMGPAAASGGYWIAAYADRIFALPTTLTGSIGVFGGKVAIAGMSQKVGVNWDNVSWGNNSGLWSMVNDFSPSEAERMNAMMDDVYSNFVARVAKGRKMTPEAVEKIARGRVWTGLRAKKIGLVDEIGGLNEALDYAAKKLGKTSHKDIAIEVMPKPKTPIEELLDFLGEQGQIYDGLRYQARIVQHYAPLLRSLSPPAPQNAASVYEPLTTRLK